MSAHVSERLDELQAQASSTRYDGIAIEDQLALIAHVRTLQQRNENLSQHGRIASNYAEKVAEKLAKIRELAEDTAIDDSSALEGIRYWLTD